MDWTIEKHCRPSKSETDVMHAVVGNLRWREAQRLDVDVVPRGIKDERESSTMTLTFSRRHTKDF